MTDRRQYTFEDWNKKGFALPRFPEGGKVSLFELNQEFPRRIIQDLPYALYKFGSMPEEEFNKIRDKQKKAYQILLGYHTEKAINKIQDRKSDKVYLKNRKAHIENVIKKTGAKILKKATDDLDLSRLHSLRCNEIIERKKNGKSQHSYEWVKKDSQTGEIIKEYRLTESFEISILRAELVEIENKLDNVHSNDEPSLKKDDIFIKYFNMLTKDGYKREKAFNKVVNWLKDMGYSKESVKKTFDITLEFDAFVRNANNHPEFRKEYESGNN